MKLKVCGLRDHTNIKELISSIQPNYMGFIFYDKSPRFIGNDWEIDINNIIPKEIIRVGVFVNASKSYIISNAEKYHLNAIQLHGNESPEFCKDIKSKGYIIIKAFQVNEDFDFLDTKPYQTVCDYVLFDTKSKNHGGSGNKFDWNLLSKYNYQLPIFLSGGISMDDLNEINELNHVNIHALDINSRFEIAPALKDVNLIKIFKQSLTKKD